MNIMIAASYSAPKSGNFIASLIALGRRLREQNQNVIYVFPQKCDWYYWFIRENLEVCIVGDDLASKEKQVASLNRLLSKYSIDILHVHFGAYLNAITQCRIELPDVKIIVHDHMDFSVKRSIITQYLRMIIISANYQRNNISVISVMERKYKSYLFTKKKWFIPNGISLERNTQYSMSREECRNVLNLKDSEIVCLLLAWNPQIKGLDIALKAIQKCREDNPNICLGIIGAGVNKPKESVKEFIENECSISASEPWIRYFDSFEDMYAVHRAVDIYLSTSRRDAFSYGILEAISQNKPVVMSDIPGTRWASEYDNHYMFHSENADECSKAILNAINDAKESTNSADLLEKYEINKWCDTVINVYHHV